MNIQQSDYEFFLDQNDKYLRRAKVVSALTFCFCFCVVPVLVICFFVLLFGGKLGCERSMGRLVGIAFMGVVWLVLKLNTLYYKRTIVRKMMGLCMRDADVHFSPRETMNLDLLDKNLFFGIKHDFIRGEDLFKGKFKGCEFGFCDVELSKSNGKHPCVVVRGLTFCADLQLGDKVRWEDVCLLITTRNEQTGFVDEMCKGRALKCVEASELGEMHEGFASKFKVHGLGTCEEKWLLNLHVQQLLAYVGESYDSLVDEKDKYPGMGVAIVIRDNRMLMFVAGKSDLFDVDAYWWKLQDKVNRDFKYLFFMSEVLRRFDAFNTIEERPCNISDEEIVVAKDQENLTAEMHVDKRPVKAYDPSKLTNLDGTLNIDGKSLLQQRIEAENEDLFTQKSRKTLFKFLFVMLVIVGASILVTKCFSEGDDMRLNADRVAIVDTEAGDDWECYFHCKGGKGKSISTAYALVPENVMKPGRISLRDDVVSTDPQRVEFVLSKLFGYVHCEYINYKAEKKFGGRYRNVYEGEMWDGKRDGYGVFRTGEDVVEEGYWTCNRQGYTITYKGDDRLYYYDNSADNPEIDPDSVRTYTFRVKPSGAIFYNKELLTKDSPSYETIRKIKAKIDRYVVDSRKATKQKREKLKALLKKYQRPAAK